jgi:hypothetical protein
LKKKKGSLPLENAEAHPKQKPKAIVVKDPVVDVHHANDPTPVGENWQNLVEPR